MARRILEDYISEEGHMYYWATLYNIPWMLLYFLHSRPCYGLEVRTGSPLEVFLSSRKDVRLTQGRHKEYVKVDKVNKFLKELFGTDMVINEFRFPALVQKVKYRQQWLIDLAKEIMPEI